MFCKNCGGNLKDEARFCPVCGTPVGKTDNTVNPSGSDNTTTVQPVKSKKWKEQYTVFVLIGIFAVAIAIGLGARAILSARTSKEGTPLQETSMQQAADENKPTNSERIETDVDEGEDAVSDQFSTQEDAVELTDETGVNADLYPKPERTLSYSAKHIQSGDDIKYIQAALIEMNYTGISVNGYYDSETQDAVRRFQKNHAYTQNGIVDTQMAENIEEALEIWREKQSHIPETTAETRANADLYPIPERKLYYSSRTTISGEDVKYVQAALIEMNYSGISVTGTFDSATASAVKRFQTNHNLAVDGIVGEETTAALQQYLAIWREKH